jgi:hypothetical protein
MLTRQVFHPVKDPATGLADDVGYSWSGPYFRAAGKPDACNGERCLGSNMTMCWNENSAPGSDEMMYDTANAKHGIEVMRNASKSEQPFFIALGTHREGGSDCVCVCVCVCVCALIDCVCA